MNFGIGQRRGWQEACSTAGRAALPYWFALSGIVLGAGGVWQGRPIVSACGAVAGVTAGLLHQHRSSLHRVQIDALRERLRNQRADSEDAAAELRHALSALQTELWQQRLLTVVSQPALRLTVPFAAGGLGEPVQPAVPESASNVQLVEAEPEDEPEIESDDEPDVLPAAAEVAPVEESKRARVVDLRDPSEGKINAEKWPQPVKRAG
jgi:hypothetical protein